MKKQRGRLEYSIMNSGISTGIYIMRLLIQFIARSIFIRFLGETYLGLNGLFTNILSLLSVSDLALVVQSSFHCINRLPCTITRKSWR